MNPRRISPSCEANPTTSSRHSARPIATRSEIWRTLGIRGPAARTVGQVRLEPPGDRPALAARGATGGRARLDVIVGRLLVAKRAMRIHSTRGCRARPDCAGARRSRVGPTSHRKLESMTTSPSSSPVRALSRSAWARRSRPRRPPPPPSSPPPTPPSANRSAARLGGPGRALDRTENAQPALLATSIAYLAALRERWAAAGLPRPTPAFAAGHSMGQYSAMVAAEVISLADGIRLVRERGRLMQASGEGRDGAMAAIIGLDDAALPALVDRASEPGRLRRRQPQCPGPGRRVRRARRDRGRQPRSPGRSAPSARSSCPSRSPPTRR